MSSRLFLVSALLLAPFAVHAAAPKQGTDSYTTVYVMTSSSAIKLGDRTVGNSDASGVSRNDNGGPMFNNMSARCLGTFENQGGKHINGGSCVEMDRDGDQIFTTYKATGNQGVHTIIGGTGKYAGISGQAPYTVYPIKSSDGRSMAVVQHKATWKLP